MKNQRLIVWTAIALVFLYLLNFRLTSSARDGHWTVYGTKGCGWTRKQLDHMKSRGISHTFVDCEKEDCGNMNAFPTMKSPSGETIVGFSSI